MSLLSLRANQLVLGHLSQASRGRVITRSVNAQDDESPFDAPVDVINYALTLEHLEATFYRAVEGFSVADFGAINYQESVREKLLAIAKHEADHVDALTAVVNQLGGEPVAEAKYDFGYTDLSSFLEVAAVIEGVGVAAYGGAARYLIDEDALLTAALTIHGVEARHASYLNTVTGKDPFPEAFETPMAPADVLKTAGPFIVG